MATAEWGCSEGLLWMQSWSLEQGAAQAKVDLLDRNGACGPAIAVLKECSWNSAHSSQVYCIATWGVNPDTDKVDFSISVGAELYGGSHDGDVLGWLRTMRQLGGNLTSEADEIVHSSPRCTARVDASTGFLNSLVMTTEGKSPMHFRLASLDLESAPPASSFAIPNDIPDAKNVSEQLLRSQLSRARVREASLQRVHGLLKREERVFDEALQEEVSRFLWALYDPKILESYGAWLESTKADSAGYADWLGEQAQLGRSREDLTEATERRRTKLEGYLESARSDLHAAIPPDPDGCADSRHWRAIRELEDSLLDERLEALIARPMLEDFDARVAAALDRQP